MADELTKGLITEDDARTAREAYAAAAEGAADAGPDAADRAGATAAVSALERKALETERRQVLQTRARARLLTGIADYKTRRGYTGAEALGGGEGGGNGKGGWRQGGRPAESGPFKKGAVAAETLPLILRNKPGLSGGPFASVEGRYLAVRGLFDAKMAAVIERFETHFGFDTPHRATLENVVREAFGEDTGDAVSKTLAQAWGDASELARGMFNEAGGDIPKLERWGLPQTHDAGAVYRAGKDTWVDAITPMLDRQKMVDRDTGQPMTDEQMRATLEGTWESISSRGLVNAHPDERLGAGSLASRRTDERFLTFKSADDWLQYQGQFGRSDAFDTMLGHLDSMAKDIGAMQVLGPNPAAQFEWLKRMAEIEAAQEKVKFGVEAAEPRGRKQIDLAERMWDTYTGKAAVPVNDTLARVSQGTRQYLIGAQLGSAILTDMPSAPFFGSIARTFAGIGAKGDMLQLGRLLADPEMRAVARRMEFINDTSRDGLVSSTQDSLRLLSVGEKAGQGMNAIARRLPPTTLRLSGLSGLFEQRKRSFRMSFMGALADAADRSLADLRAGGGEGRWLATELDARGFGEEEWSKIRAAQPWEPAPGVRILRPSDITASAGQDLALRVGEMVLNMEQLAVPVSGSLRTRAAMNGMGRPGSVPGEIIRSVALYKTFLLNVHDLYTQEMALRAMASAPGWMSQGVAGNAGRVAWAAGSIIALTLSGAMSLQLKAIVRGEDPIFMGSPKFWGAALLQGGSLGILGDFYYSSQSRTGRTLGVVGAGPLGDLIADGLDTAREGADLVLHPLDEKAQSRASRQALTDLRKYTPFGSLWWTRTAFHRGVLDQMQRALDPDAQEAFQRSVDRMRRATGQDRWWEPGDAYPSRAPNIAAAWSAPS